MTTTKQQISRRFDIQELVCPHIYNRHGEKAWDMLDENLLKVLIWIREKLGKPIYVNNWNYKQGTLSQRGMRCNCCQLVKDKTAKGIPYVSAHVLGKAVDFDVKGMTAQEVRDWIYENRQRLPHPVRLEDGVTWVHLDVRSDKWSSMVEYFNA